MHKRDNPSDYVKGDLVIFTGYAYAPDFVYVDDYAPMAKSIGVVIGDARNGYYSDVLYRVYWFTSGHITTVVKDHLRLAYVKK